MHKIDGDGATAQNEFTEGDAQQNIPATVVTAAFMNDVQNDLINVLEEMDITPTKGQQDQIFAAMLEFQKRGGRKTQIAQALSDNQAAPADITDFPTFDAANILGLEFMYRAYRESSAGVKIEMGRGFIIYNNQSSSWEVSALSAGAGAGLGFEIANVAATEFKLQYVTDNLGGSSYSGELKITDIKEIKA